MRYRFDSSARKPRDPVVNYGHPLTRGLIAAFFFTEGGGTSVIDAVKRQHNGTISGPNWVPGTLGPALNFTTQAVEVANPTTINFAADWSAVARIKRSAAGNNNHNCLVAKAGTADWGPGAKGWFVGDATYQNKIFYSEYGGVNVSNTPLAPDTVYNVGMSYRASGGQLKFYLNGRDDGTSTWNASTDHADHVVKIGRVAANLHQFHGIIEFMCIYQRVLGPDEFLILSKNPFAILLSSPYSIVRTPSAPLREGENLFDPVSQLFDSNPALWLYKAVLWRPPYIATEDLDPIVSLLGRGWQTLKTPPPWQAETKLDPLSNLFGIPLLPFYPLTTVYGDICAKPSPIIQQIGLPQLTGSESLEELSSILNSTFRVLESRINRLIADPECKACIENCVVTLDLARCSDWKVDVTEDICKIDVLNGTPGQKWSAQFVSRCPPNRRNEPLRISGWPMGIGAGAFTLKCGQSQSFFFLVDRGGSRPINLDTPSFSPGYPGGGPGGCGCQATDNLLTIKACGKINCKATNPSLTLEACGGTPPYDWSTTAGTISKSGVFGQIATLKPGTNTGQSVSGVAYKKVGLHSVGGGSSCQFCGVSKTVFQEYGCNDQPIDGQWLWDGDSCFPTSTNLNCRGGAFPTCASLPDCRHFNPDCGPTVCSHSHIAYDAGLRCTLGICDVRTDNMIAAGCAPCTVQMDGAVVTVTDADGTSAAVVISVD